MWKSSPKTLAHEASANSRTVLLAASLAAPVAFLTTVAVALLLIGFGVARLIPGDVIDAPDQIAGGASSVKMLSLATGGIVTSAWGPYLVGSLQVLLGLGLLMAGAALGTRAAAKRVGSAA